MRPPTSTATPTCTATQLCGALAAECDVAPEQVVVGNGSVALIETILSAMCAPGDEVVYAWRSFEAYPIALAVAGATGVAVPLADGGRHDLPAMVAAVTERTKAILLCSPNNPTGPALTDAEVRAALADLPSDVLVLLDEAYVEFVRASGAVDGLALAATIHVSSCCGPSPRPTA